MSNITNMPFNKLGVVKRLILNSKFQKAKKLLKPLAKKGNSKAQLIFGYLYFGGDFDISRKESEYWLKSAARKGEAEAMALLATTNFKDGYWANFSESRAQMRKIEKAANKGSVEAQRWLATTYAHGDIVPADYQKVVYWDTKAAEQGLSESQHDLGVMWMTGEAGRVDIDRSLHWYLCCVNRDHNTIDSEWAFKRIVEIYEGRFGENYKDLDKANIWKKRKEFASRLPFRNHPDWFYKLKMNPIHKDQTTRKELSYSYKENQSCHLK